MTREQRLGVYREHLEAMSDEELLGEETLAREREIAIKERLNATESDLEVMSDEELLVFVVRARR